MSVPTSVEGIEIGGRGRRGGANSTVSVPTESAPTAVGSAVSDVDDNDDPEVSVGSTSGVAKT